MIQLIKEIIASRIRPTVEEHGGDIKFDNFNEETGLLTVRLVGACAGCPSSTATLKNGIEKMFLYYVAEVKKVEAVD